MSSKVAKISSVTLGLCDSDESDVELNEVVMIESDTVNSVKKDTSPAAKRRKLEKPTKLATEPVKQSIAADYSAFWNEHGDWFAQFSAPATASATDSTAATGSSIIAPSVSTKTEILEQVSTTFGNISPVSREADPDLIAKFFCQPNRLIKIPRVSLPQKLRISQFGAVVDYFGGSFESGGSSSSTSSPLNPIRHTEEYRIIEKLISSTALVNGETSPGSSADKVANTHTYLTIVFGRRLGNKNQDLVEMGRLEKKAVKSNLTISENLFTEILQAIQSVGGAIKTSTTPLVSSSTGLLNAEESPRSSAGIESTMGRDLLYFLSRPSDKATLNFWISQGSEFGDEVATAIQASGKLESFKIESEEVVKYLGDRLTLVERKMMSEVSSTEDIPEIEIHVDSEKRRISFGITNPTTIETIGSMSKPDQSTMKQNSNHKIGIFLLLRFVLKGICRSTPESLKDLDGIGKEESLLETHKYDDKNTTPAIQKTKEVLAQKVNMSKVLRSGADVHMAELKLRAEQTKAKVRLEQQQKDLNKEHRKEYEKTHVQKEVATNKTGKQPLNKADLRQPRVADTSKATGQKPNTVDPKSHVIATHYDAKTTLHVNAKGSNIGHHRKFTNVCKTFLIRACLAIARPDRFHPLKTAKPKELKELKVNGRGVRVLDLCCGHGQDLPKFSEILDFKDSYMGLDVSSTAILEARRRFADISSKRKALDDKLTFSSNLRCLDVKRLMVDLQGNTRIGAATASSSSSSTNPTPERDHYSKIRGDMLTQGKFDLISVQLAIHYIVSDEQAANSFFNSCVEMLSSTGVLCVSFVDCYKLAGIVGKISEAKKTDKIITFNEFTYDQNDVFKIKFDTKTLPRGGKSLPEQGELNSIFDSQFGIKYLFELYETTKKYETTKLLDLEEDVIPVRKLFECAKNSGLEVVTHKSFDGLLDLYLNHNMDVATRLLKGACREKMSVSEKELFGLYRVVGFRKKRVKKAS